MGKIGVWHIQQQGPAKLSEAYLDLEKTLEDWIEHDPSLVQSGLIIVGRQVMIEGGRLDLLALDPQGRWVVIEIKAGAVRNETIGQAFYYAAVLDRMPFKTLHGKVDDYLRTKSQKLETLMKERGIDKAGADEPRDIQILLVGTSLSYGLDQVVNYLSEKFEFPLSIISFGVYQTASGERVLVRELTESDLPQSVNRPRRKLATSTLADLEKIAAQHGASEILLKLVDTAERLGFHTRMYAGSVMFAPPQNKTRMLFTVWAKGKRPGILRTFVAPEVFAQYYPISEEEAVRQLGPSGWRDLDYQGAEKLIAGLNSLFIGTSE